MKYTLEYCMFQENGSTPNLPQCETECAGLSPVLLASWFSPEPAKQYSYCSIDDTAFPTYAGSCASCLQSYNGSVVLGNCKAFHVVRDRADHADLNTMQSACDKQPDASLGETVPLQRQLFDTATVGTATTSASSTSAATSSTSSAVTTIAATTSSASSSSSSTSSATAAPATSQKSSGLSSGAAAGIGIGCAALAIAVVGGLAWFIIRRRRQNTPPPHDDHPYQDSKATPVSNTPVTPVPAYAQQLGSQEVHEMDTRQSTQWTSELDGRPVQ